MCNTVQVGFAPKGNPITHSAQFRLATHLKHATFPRGSARASQLVALLVGTETHIPGFVDGGGGGGVPP